MLLMTVHQRGLRPSRNWPRSRCEREVMLWEASGLPGGGSCLVEHQGTWQGLASASAQNTGWRSDKAPAGVLRTLSCCPLLVRPPHPKVHAEAGSWVRQSAQCSSCSSSTAAVSTLCIYTHLILTTTFRGSEYSKNTSSSTPMALPSYRGGN